MARFRVRVRGTGRVLLAAYGVADAEHQVEKEIERLWPGARASVREVRRAAEAARIVEEFTVEFRLDAAVEVEAPSEAEAKREAFRESRARLERSRYTRTSWESEEVVRLDA